MRQFFTSMRLRILMLLLLAAAPGFVISFSTAVDRRSEGRSALDASATRITDLSAGTMRSLYDSGWRVMDGIAAMPALQAADVVGCVPVLSGLLHAYAGFTEVVAANANGDVFCAAPQVNAANISDRYDVRETLATGSLAFSEYRPAGSQQAPVFSMSYPIRDNGGTTIGVITASTKLAIYNDLLAQAHVPSGGQVTLIDPGGRLILHSLDTHGSNSAGRQFTPTVWKTEAPMRVHDVDGVVRVYSFVPLGTGSDPLAGLYMGVGLPEAPAIAAANDDLRRNLLILAASTLALMLIGLAMGYRSIARPLDALLGAARRVAAGDLTARSGLSPNAGEFGRLAGAFDSMAESMRRGTAELERRAFYDPLTELPNRALFRDRVAHALEAATRGADGLAVLYVDLDGFKAINDSLGHAAGDALLQLVGRRLVACLRPGDTVARLGGDEYTLLLERVADLAAVEAVAERVLAALRAPATIEGREVVIAASIGIVHSSTEYRPAGVDELLSAADLALYQAKAAGKSRSAVFDPAMKAQAKHRFDMETDLRRAIERGELEVYYQPQISSHDGAMEGVEALVRWRHPQFGSVSPAEFIPVAEESGLIVPLGLWVLRESCRQVAEWQRQGLSERPLLLSVNLSPRQMADPALVERVQAALAESGLPAEQLCLEITEGVLMEDSAATAAALRALCDLGVQFAIDDFGTGYSSLSYLQRYPVASVKIDRCFVMELEHNASARAIVQTVTSLAHVLGMTVTAEGVETAEQLSIVRSAGCDASQGFFFARPVPAAALVELLSAASAKQVA